jgi:integrase
VLTLTKAQIDLQEGTLRLVAGSTKNRDGRLVYLTPELEAGITGQLACVEALEHERGEAIPWPFPHLVGRHQVERIKSFRKRWTRACRQAGCAGALRHDLRRTALRNMVHLGIPEGVVMRLVGHRTRSMLDRYNIVSPAGLREAALGSYNFSHHLSTPGWWTHCK